MKHQKTKGCEIGNLYVKYMRKLVYKVFYEDLLREQKFYSSVTAASTLRSQRVPFKIEFRKLNFLILLHYGDFWTRFSRQVNLYMKIISRSNKGGIPHHIIEYHIEEFHIKDVNFLWSKIRRDLWKLWVILKKEAPSDIIEEIKD